MKGLSFVSGQIPKAGQTQRQTLTALPVLPEKPLLLLLPNPPNHPTPKELQPALIPQQKSFLIPNVIFFLCCFKMSVMTEQQRRTEGRKLSLQ